MRFGHMTLMKMLIPAAVALAGVLAISAAQAEPRAASPLAAIAAGQASSVALASLSGAERADALAAANRSLNGVRQMQGRFVQVAPDGSRASGMFYLQRPGKLRFQYDPPATMLIVSDGRVVSMRDTALRTTERTPLDSTPLNLILGASIDLERNARIVRVSRSGAWTLVTARDRSGATDGAITLHFYGDNAELRSWDVVDAAGGRTRVALSDVTHPASLDRRLFRLEDILENRPRRP